MIPAVAYYRVSTGDQEQSIDVQQKEVAAYAARNGYEIVREYKDVGVSGGDTERRKGFQTMRRDAEGKNDFRAILCTEQGRLGRFDLLDAGYWTKPFRDRGIKLVTVTKGETDWTSFVGRVMYGLEQEGKKQKAMDAAASAAMTMPRLVADGGWPNNVPYGFKIARRPHPSWMKHGGLPYLVEDPDAAGVVRELFRRFAAGEPMGALARSLNDRGVPSPYAYKHGRPDTASDLWRGRPLTAKWSQGGVRCILANPAYAGRTVYGRTSRSKYYELSRGGFAQVSRARKEKRNNSPKRL